MLISFNRRGPARQFDETYDISGVFAAARPV
jgi:hypothetical protein